MTTMKQKKKVMMMTMTMTKVTNLSLPGRHPAVLRPLSAAQTARKPLLCLLPACSVHCALCLRLPEVGEGLG